MIDLMPNITFFVQLGVFLVTLLILHLLVFRPILRIIDRRQALTEGAQEEAQVLDSKTEGMVEEYQCKVKEARGEGLVVKDKLAKEGEGQAKEILAKARGKLEASLEENRQEVAAQSKEAQLALRGYSRELSAEMAQKLLGRKVAG